VAFYCALFLTLFARYGALNPGDVGRHIGPFSIALIFWLLIFYAGSFYDRRAFGTGSRLAQHFLVLLAIGAVVMIVLFYFVPAFGIAPKANLFIFLIFFGVLLLLWRLLMNSIFVRISPQDRILMIGSGEAMDQLVEHIGNYPSLGYRVVAVLNPSSVYNPAKAIEEAVGEHDINVIVANSQSKKDWQMSKTIYEKVLEGVRFIPLSKLYEIIFKKISIAELEDIWSLRYIPRHQSNYARLRYLFESLIASLMFVVLLPLMAVVALLISLTSSGSPIYRQKRVGYRGKEFWLYKFRTMYSQKSLNPDADASKPSWWAGGKDGRVTWFGRFLRATHLDELPQLFNILRGDMSFIGPRPERPEFTQTLEQKIPFYELRHLIKPGITGWAQINFGYGASTKDAYEKLQYEIYYLENRSLLFDMIILLKTLKKFFR